MNSKIRSRRFCLLLSYCGKNYYGMQRNPNSRTIEECLLKALRDTELITEEHYVRPQLMFFQRAARTDKSVSAIRQIVSLKIPETVRSLLDNINNALPNDIRVMGCKRVTQSFNAKNFCDARTYSYLMPTFALCPITDLTKEDYRVSNEVLTLFNLTLEGFIGTHSFHNFTSGKSSQEDSANRVIRFMKSSEPFFPCGQDKIEFVVIRVKGQSFMMHQIRKMIGMAIAVVKGFATEDHLRRSLEAPYMDVPKAPGLGLMLEEVHYDRYNRRFGGDGHHEPIEWNEHNEKIDKFKEEYIYPVVVETEINEKSMFNWLSTLALHSYGDAKPNFRNLLKSAMTSSDGLQNGENHDDENDDLKSQKRAKLDETLVDEPPTTEVCRKEDGVNN